MKLGKYTTTFDGQLLRRGFWLYVLRVQHKRRLYIYVGRTGDNSSPNAASPFSRIGRHLDLRPVAKSNTLVRQLRAAGLDPSHCRFQLIAIGPLYSEEKSMQAHKPLRDKTAAIENAVATLLRNRGFVVLGHHTASTKIDAPLLGRVRSLLGREFAAYSEGRRRTISR
jgi:hypothetical protein